jgi:hypothetical protein
MPQQFFEMLDSGGEGCDELVVVASAKIKRPLTPAEADFKLGLKASPPTLPRRKIAAGPCGLIFLPAKV